MKWNIRKEGIDMYFLEYKDKILPFHSNVGVVNELQSVYKNARINMIKELKEKGITLQDLTIETKTEDGKTIYDSSSRNYIEESYIQEEQARILKKVIKNTLGMDYQDLILDIGLDTQDEVNEFFSELGNCLIGKTPSRREQ